MPAIQMRVQMYVPAKMYGFLADDEGRVAFFHLGSFQPGRDHLPPKCSECPGSCPWGQAPPPPILGEAVEVEVDFESADGDKKPRADKVVRLGDVVAVEGVVDTFDAQRGFGFVRGRDSETYHLHKSEITDNRLPLPGSTVMFYVGTRQGRPRACHVRVCEK